MRELTPLRWKGDRLLVLDQRRLPTEEIWVDLKNEKDVFSAIKRMYIRGAPAIGIAAAFGFVLGLRSTRSDRAEILLKKADEIETFLSSARPTAVNLKWALKRMHSKAVSIIKEGCKDKREMIKELEMEAIRLLKEDDENNRRMGRYGSRLIPKRASILTHCNAGALAVGGYGTAIGVIRSAFEEGKDITVYVDETRPYLQGARLTSYELKHLGIKHFVITDNTAGFLMQRGMIDLVITGADRVVKNGDTANKIGTYSLAVLAKENRIPFYIAAPSLTFDLTLNSGDEIPIEERSDEEVLLINGKRIAPEGVRAVHYGFDVTPARYIRAIITEKGIIKPPYTKNIPAKIKLDI